jgi:hypothetical protein
MVLLVALVEAVVLLQEQLEEAALQVKDLQAAIHHLLLHFQEEVAVVQVQLVLLGQQQATVEMVLLLQFQEVL